LEFIRTYSDSLIPNLQEVINHNGNGTISLDNVKITAPIPYPRRNVFCLGKNYADHALEVKSLPGGKAAIPDHPIYFTKVADPVIGHMDKVLIPKDYTEKIDYEVELAIIIGKTVRIFLLKTWKAIYLDILLEMIFLPEMSKLNMFSGLKEKA